ncbi:histidine phosphatase family protein [Gordonia hankookensis]|uniref:Histidine phosphatase family protein n=1 Tax=Gordonia hankookensis TaxID=589403 RepID=A0ABR7WCI0_9ACTN|nr:histidine phosphatase family protein [Gordonia hankookensis]MBD1320509.1 histidine phosphatase family protein [Gordonia hankookensis]
MELLLIRHAQPFRLTDPNGADPDLTPEGEEQARRLAAALADGRYGKVDRLVSSPMRRAAQTAGFAREALSLDVATDQRLVELDHGWTTYGAVDAYTDRSLLLQDMNGGRLGENTFDPDLFRERVVDGIEEVAAPADVGAVAIVCHGGVINAYLSHVIGTANMFFVEPYHTSVTRVLALEGGHRQVLSINEIDHLR